MRGDGRIFQRGRIYWIAYSLRGREFRESTKTGDEKQAAKFLKYRLKEVGSDQLGIRKFVTPKNQRSTVRDLLKALEQDFHIRGKLTARNKSNLKIAQAAFGDVKAISLTSQQIDSYVEERTLEGAAPATINRAVGLVRQAYQQAIERGELAAAPKFRHLSEAGNERKGFFEADEFARLLEHLPSDLKDFCRFAYITGWRKSEIASLTWSDVEDNVIRLRGENSKNGEARSVVIAGELVSIIERRKQSRLSNGVLTSLVFHRDGRPIAEFRKAWASASRKAGIEGRLFHDFRRTAVRNMVRSGVPQSVAMRISGHKTASMFRRYDIANEEDLRQAIEAVEKYHEASRQKVVSIAQ